MAENYYAFPTNREFVRTIHHNNKEFRLRSVFDYYQNKYDFRNNVLEYLNQRGIKQSEAYDYNLNEYEVDDENFNDEINDGMED